MSSPHRYEWFSRDGYAMREQLPPASADVGSFVRDENHCCYADIDDLADNFPNWCSYCVTLHHESGGIAQPPKKDPPQGKNGEYIKNDDDGCPLFQIRVEVVRDTILEILLGMGIGDYRRCASDLDTALRFEATLRSMMRAAIRQNPGTTAFSFNHLLRRFVPDEWS